jgi:calcineurin-like phosphoesterase family protein
MWRAIKRNWNSVVTKDDTVWIAGDLTLKKAAHKDLLARMMEELNGGKHLVIGNHDQMLPTDYEYIGITSVHYPATFLQNGWMIAHDPTFSNVLKAGQTLVCGHQHGNLFNSQWTKNRVFVIDVGVDVREPYFTPISEQQIKDIKENGEPGQQDYRQNQKEG